ncbi:MAG: cupin domain-containing protein [Candidatus Dormibacteraeota bacterium]|nr:cupin domain-containing protein [Candidatus Dormibacteraeota bacterium]
MRRPPDAIAPDGSEIRFLVPPPPGAEERCPPPDRDARTASLVEVRLPAGEHSRPVRHRTVEEIWYVLSGRGELWRRAPGGDEHRDPLEPGGTAVIPTGWAFSFSASEGADLVFLCHTSPPWPGAEEAEPADR